MAAGWSCMQSGKGVQVTETHRLSLKRIAQAVSVIDPGSIEVAPAQVALDLSANR
jgi:hypothetical protein